MTTQNSEKRENRKKCHIPTCMLAYEVNFLTVKGYSSGVAPKPKLSQSCTIADLELENSGLRRIDQ